MNPLQPKILGCLRLAEHWLHQLKSCPWVPESYRSRSFLVSGAFGGTARTAIWGHWRESSAAAWQARGAKTQMLVPLVAANAFPDCTVVHVTWKEFWMSLWQNKLVSEIMGEDFFFLDDQLLSCLVAIYTQQSQVVKQLIITNIYWIPGSQAHGPMKCKGHTVVQGNNRQAERKPLFLPPHLDFAVFLKTF